MHSKKENAHEESIWTCAWGRLTLGDEGAEKENENNGNMKGEEKEDENVTTVDIIATGGVDDLVKVWEYTSDGEMKLKHKLSEHSLGVVSVDLSKDVKSKYKLKFGIIFVRRIRSFGTFYPYLLYVRINTIAIIKF